MAFIRWHNDKFSRMIFIIGIVAGFVALINIPHFAISQSTNVTNQSSFGPNAIDLNASKIIVVPGTIEQGGLSEPSVIRDPGGDDVLPEIIGAPGTIIQDPKGDDTMEKDCYYGALRYSPGATVEMPAAGGGKVVKVCWNDGSWADWT